MPHLPNKEKLSHVSLILLHHLHPGPPVSIYQGQDDLPAEPVPFPNEVPKNLAGPTNSSLELVEKFVGGGGWW